MDKVKLDGTKAIAFIDLVKKDYKKAIEYIIENNIDPNSDEEILSDYGILHSKNETVAIDFCKRMRDIGAIPEGCPSNIKVVVRRNYVKLLKDFFERDVFRFKRNKEDSFTFLNIAIMDDAKESYAYLKDHMDLKEIKTYLGIPYPLYTAIRYKKEWAVKDIFKNELFSDFYFSEGTAIALGSLDLKKEFNSAKKIIKIYLNELSKKEDVSKQAKKVIKNFEIKQDSINEDIADLFKFLQYEALKNKIDKKEILVKNNIKI